MAELLTDSILVVADRVYTILNAVKGTLTYGSITLQDVWFGDQLLLPRTPALCVQPGIMRRPLAGVPAQTENMIDTTLLLYHAKVDEQQTALRETIGLAEVIEKYLHINHLQLLNASGDRLTTHSFVTEKDPGYVYRSGTLYHAVQMNWYSLTKTRLQAP